MKHKLILFLFFGLAYLAVSGQETPPEPPTTAAPIEGMDSKEAVKSSDDRPRNFSLVFNRGLMLANSSPDSVPLNGNGSGTYSLGGRIKINLVNDVLRLRITPSISWTHLNYDQTNLKTFPTVADSLPYTLTLEKHTLVFGELPVGLMFNITRDEDGDPKFFVEAGGYVGYLLAANYKTRFKDEDGFRVKQKRRDMNGIANELEQLRYGLYARAGYTWASLYFAFRLSEVFDEFTNPELRPINSELYKNPIIPPMELGITIFL